MLNITLVNTIANADVVHVKGKPGERSKEKENDIDSYRIGFNRVVSQFNRVKMKVNLPWMKMGMPEEVYVKGNESIIKVSLDMDTSSQLTPV